ncbi:MAG TPA: fibronectin type III domain-containing protein [Acidimicrobiales bacterium]|nr:fibronectin type III domain-containing protein [Acidimicrobiales bacterium]
MGGRMARGRSRRGLLLVLASWIAGTGLACVAPGAGASGGDYLVVAGNGATTPLASATGSGALGTGLSQPGAVTADPSGNLVVADTGNSLVEVVAESPTNPGYLLPAGTTWTPGDVYLLAGGGSQAPSAAGTVASATRLAAPGALAVDAAGDVLVADTGDHEVEVLAESATNPGYLVPGGAWVRGELYVVAGGGSTALGATPVVATAARLVAPAGLAIDASGDVVISDGGTNLVSVLALGASDPGYPVAGGSWTPGDLYLLAGSGAATPTLAGAPARSVALSHPEGVAVDPAGDVLVADTDDGAIEVLAVSAADPGYVLGSGATWTPGDLYVLAGAGSSAPSPGGSPAAATLLNLPQGVGVDPEGDVLVADTDDGEIEVLAVSAANPGYVLGPGATWTPGECYVVVGGGSAAPSPAGSPAGAVALRQPDSLAGLASGAVAVADTGRYLVELLLLPPSAPPLTSSSAGDASAALAWDAPARDGGSAPTGYLVRATPAGSGTPAVTEDLPATARAATIGGLVDGVSYLVSVAATNAAGTGPPAGARVVPEAPPTPGSAGPPGAGASSGAAGPPGAGGPPSAGSAPAPGVARSGAPGERRPRPTVRVGAPVLEAAGRLLGPQLRCEGATCRGAVEVTFERRVRVRLGAATTEALETTVVAEARFALAPGATRRVGLRLTAAGRRLLRGRRRVVATETVVVRGGRRAVRRVLLVARPRRAPRGSARRRHDLGILGAPEKGGGPTER